MSVSSKKGRTLEKRMKKIIPEAVSIDAPSQDQSCSGSNEISKLFQPTGDFEEDFAQLCQMHGVEMMPSVLPHPRRSCSPEKDKKSSKRLSEVANRLQPISSETQDSGRSQTRIEQSVSQDRQALTVRLPKQSKISNEKSQPQLSAPTKRRQSNKSEESQSDKGQPSTFCLTDRRTNFTPCVQVTYLQVQRFRQVKELYIRGWQVDGAMLKVLTDCCVLLTPHLSLLQLWRVGLTANGLDTLASILPRCPNLTTLLLDANPLGDVNNLDKLISQDSPLQHLSLRFCQVTDQAALGLGSALGTTYTCNMKLLTLNLSHNRLGDVGVGHLARGLMTNRMLVVLNLTSNDIGDEGAAALADVLSCFTLSHEQVRHRRWLLSHKEDMFSFIPESFLNDDDLNDFNTNSKDIPSLEKKKTEHKINDKKTTKQQKVPKSLGRGSDLKKDHQHQKRSQQSSSNTYSEDQVRNVQTRRASLQSSKNSMISSSVGKNSSRRLSKQSQSGDSASLEATSIRWHPLAECASIDKHGQFWIVGNHSLLSLNLSRNMIGEKGLRLLLHMLQIQASPRPCELLPLPDPNQDDHNQQYPQHYHHLPPPDYNWSGLRRLVLHGNAVGRNNNMLQEIQNLMVIRDPLYNKDTAQAD